MTINDAMLGLLLAATLADHVTTNVFLKRGMREANPVLASVIKHWGSTGLFLLKMASWGAVVALDRIWGPASPLLLAACVGVFTAAAAYNFYQIQMLGERS